MRDLYRWAIATLVAIVTIVGVFLYTLEYNLELVKLAVDSTANPSAGNAEGQLVGSVYKIDACGVLTKLYIDQGFLSAPQRKEYCDNMCIFANVKCGSGSSSDTKGTIKNVTDTVYGTVKNFMESSDYLEGQPISDATKETWLDMSYEFAPVAFSIVPVLLNQYKAFGFRMAVLCITCYCILYSFFDMRPIVTMHNCVVAVLCMAYPSNSHTLIESVQSFIPLSLILFLIFFNQAWFQMVILILTMVGYFIYLHWVFMSKKQSHMNVFIGMMQIFVLWEQLGIVREKYAEHSLIGSGVEMFIRSMLPGGDTHLLCYNIINFSKEISLKVPSSDHYTPPQVFIFFFISQVVMFGCFRAAIGQYCMMSLRYKTGLDEAYEGLLVYMCDFWGPIRAAFRLLMRYENLNRRRIFYAAILLCIMVFEMRCAFEFLVVRLIWSTLDLAIFDSGRAKATKYLGENIDFLGESFPQDGSFPWMSLDSIFDLKDFVEEVHVTKDKFIKGVGIVLTVAGKVKLYTIRHVVEGAKTVHVAGRRLLSPKVRNLTNSVDPIVIVDMPDIGRTPPECPILMREEVDFIKHLVFINVSGEESFVTFVPRERFSVINGDLHASVDLKPGDSGGPCFAVLSNGRLRYCGAVSRGSRNTGSGNVISFVYGDVELEIDSGSDSDVDTNALARANVVRFASENTDDERDKAYKSLISFIKDNRTLFSNTYNIGQEVSISPRSDETNTLFFEEYMANKYQLDRRPPDPGKGQNDDNDDEEGNAGKKKRRDKDRKAQQKDRAAWKKRTMAADSLWNHLIKVYSNLDSLKIFECIVNSNSFPNLQEPKFIGGVNGPGTWIYVDNLPDRV